MPTIQIPAKAERILTTKARMVVLIGGRGSGKSETIGRCALMWCQTEQSDMLCAREYMTSIDESVHKMLVTLIEKLEVEGTKTTERKIDFHAGGGFRYKGFARNPQAVKSAFGFKRAWVEEAQDLSQKSLDDLTKTIRAEGAQLLFSANPQASNDPFSQRFIVPFLDALLKHGFYEDDMHLIIMMNWRDNPWHGELEAERIFDKANMSRAKYDHIWEGAFNDEVEDSIIQAEWFDAAIDAHIKLGFKPRGARVVAHDPSDVGPDPKSLCLRQGSVILNVEDRDDLDVNDACDWATSYAIEQDADLFSWDGDGLGAPLRRQISEAFDGKRIDYEMYKGSESPDRPDDIYEAIEGEDRQKARSNKETFLNKRAQYCWMLRDKFYNSYRAVEKGEYIDPDKLISVSSDIKDMKKLRSEVCRVPRKYNPRGLIQIMPKIEMRNRLKIASPNMFDAVVMSQVVPAVKKPAMVTVTIPDLRRVG